MGNVLTIIKPPRSQAWEAAAPSSPSARLLSLGSTCEPDWAGTATCRPFFRRLVQPQAQPQGARCSAFDNGSGAQRCFHARIGNVFAADKDG
jgi:hypothetical protein